MQSNVTLQRVVLCLVTACVLKFQEKLKLVINM